jgi:hypothetical protein
MERCDQGEIEMKGPSKILLATGVALALAFSALPASAQQAQQQPPQLQLKPASPSAIAAANALLAAKNATQVYVNAVPNIVQRVKDQLLANNLSYQKDLNEIAVTEVQAMAGREKEIGETLAKIYANDFTEQEMKDLTAFYKSPLGQKLLAQDPKTDQVVIGFLNQWAQGFSQTVAADFRAAMQKRGKQLGG